MFSARMFTTKEWTQINLVKIPRRRRSECSFTIYISIYTSIITYLNDLFPRKLVPAPGQMLPSLQRAAPVGLSVPPTWPRISPSGRKIRRDSTPVSCWSHFKKMDPTTGSWWRQTQRHSWSLFCTSQHVLHKSPFLSLWLTLQDKKMKPHKEQQQPDCWWWTKES